jgi:hypothetical protein
MLEPDNIRAIGERLSGGCLDSRSAGASEIVSRLRGDCALALASPSLSTGRSDEGSSGGGAAGNLKLCEKDPDGFRGPLRRAGVLGAAAAPDCLRPGRAGKEESWKGSCIVGGEPPPERGE